MLAIHANSDVANRPVSDTLPRRCLGLLENYPCVFLTGILK